MKRGGSLKGLLATSIADLASLRLKLEQCNEAAAARDCLRLEWTLSERLAALSSADYRSRQGTLFGGKDRPPAAAPETTDSDAGDGD